MQWGYRCPCLVRSAMAPCSNNSLRNASSKKIVFLRKKKITRWRRSSAIILPRIAVVSFLLRTDRRPRSAPPDFPLPQVIPSYIRRPYALSRRHVIFFLSSFTLLLHSDYPKYQIPSGLNKCFRLSSSIHYVPVGSHINNRFIVIFLPSFHIIIIVPLIVKGDTRKFESVRDRHTMCASSSFH